MTTEHVFHPRPLSPAEHEVLRLLSTGVTMKEIAAARGCAVQTVKSLLGLTYAKLGAANRVEAFIILGWLRPPDDR